MTLAPSLEPWSFRHNQSTRCDEPTSLSNQAQRGICSLLEMSKPTGPSSLSLLGMTSEKMFQQVALDLVVHVFHDALQRIRQRFGAHGAFEVAHPIPQLTHLGHDRSQRFGEWIVDLLG